MLHALALYLVNAVWQIPLVAIGAAVFERFGGFSPDGRHRMWLVALVLAVALPAFPSGAAPHAPAPAARSAPAASADFSSAMAQALVSDLPGPARILTPPRLELSPGAVALAGLAFCAATAVGLWRLVFAALAAGALARRSRAVTLAPRVAETLREAARVRGRPVPRVRASAAIATPVVVGAIRPMILTPERFADLPEDEQRAALLHEFAHVLRRDYAVNLLAELASLPVCWHPATHLIKARLRASRELACDAMASTAMASGTAYARCLVSLARSLRQRETETVLVVGLIGKSDLEERLMHLLKPRRDDGRRGSRLLAAGVAASAILAPAVMLRVTPAFADVAPPSTPAHALAAPIASVTPVAAEPTKAPPARRARGRVMRVASLAAPQSATPASQPAGPAEPPAPPAGSAPAMDVTAPALVDGEQIRRIVRQALEQSAEARKAVESAEIQRALAEVRAHAGMTAEERAQLQSEIRQTVQTALAEVRKELDSDAFRQSIRDAARAAAEAEARSAPPTR